MKLALLAFAALVPFAAAAAPQEAPPTAPPPEPAASAPPAPQATTSRDAAVSCPFAGRWKLNEELSDDPSAALRELAQQGGQGPGQGRGGRGGGRGRGGRGGGGGMGGGMGEPGGMGGGMRGGGGEPGGMGGGMGEPGEMGGGGESGDDMGAPPDDAPGGMGQAPPDEDEAVTTDGATTEVGNGDRRGGRPPRGGRGPRGGGAMDLLRRPPKTLAIAQNGAAIEIVEDGRSPRRWIPDGEPHPDERLGSGVATKARWIDASLAGEAEISSSLSVKQTFAPAPERDGVRRLYVTTRVKLARAGKSVLVRRVYDAAP